MPDLLLPLLALLVGIIGLLWGADRFVAGSAGAARNFGISPLIIGLTIVSVGTSAPEVIVSVNAALKNAGELAVGNALGSNLANMGLVLGITALVAPIPVQKHLAREESPVLLLITLLAGAALYDAFLGRGESLLLAFLFIPLITVTVIYKSKHPNPEEVEEGEEIPDISMTAAILWFALGLVILLASAEMTVWAAKSIALSLGISELVVGLTVVAIGTSLPELAASVMSAIRGHHDIAVGNVFGSNLFNLLLVMTSAGAISPMVLGSDVFNRDYLSMLIMTVLMIALVIAALHKGQKKGLQSRISRRAGAILLIMYGLYYVLLGSTLASGS